MRSVYEMVKAFKRKYGITICWRLKKHSAVIERYLNPGEKVTYAFAAQKNDNPFDIVTTCVVAVTNRRILIAQKRVLWGYFLTSITPDLFNDLTVKAGLLWSKIHIDTVKEVVKLSNIDKKATPEIKEHITSFMLEEKKK